MNVTRNKRGWMCALRSVAAVLLTASLLCALGGQALAAGEPVASPITDNKPAVTVEGNAVIDGNGHFTGFFELALKVRTTFDPAQEVGGKLVSHPFGSAAVALRYDAGLLTPVSWSYTQEDYEAAADGVDVSGATRLAPVSLEAKKPDTGVLAMAQVEGYIPADSLNFDRPTALLTMSARAAGSRVTYDHETVVCVVRFKYNKTQLVMNETDSYQFLHPAGSPMGQDAVQTKKCVVWFADDAAAAGSTAQQSVWYQGMKSITETASTDKTYHYYYLDALSLTAGGVPSTKGGMVFTEATPGTRDYSTNLLRLDKGHTPGGLAFQLVNRTSYASNGVNVDNLATILFYDWDSTLINVLTVEKD